jgi:hypothetical protein
VKIKLIETDGDRSRYRIEGDAGEALANGFKAREGKVAWCEFTIYRSHNSEAQPFLSSFGGEVWPLAWPELFEWLKSVQATRLTPAGAAAIMAVDAVGEWEG